LAQRIKAGERCEFDKEYTGLLEDYNCVFREAPKKCYPDYFGYAMAFYKGDDFPALQLVWPDKENKWPWEIDFNHQWIRSQPLLEHWPDEKTKSHWVFDEQRNLGVFTTTRVLDGNHPILLVCHDDDGSWQFLCGTTDDPEHCRLICLNDMVKLDPSVNEVADLAPLGTRRFQRAVSAQDTLIGTNPSSSGASDSDQQVFRRDCALEAARTQRFSGWCKSQELELALHSSPKV
jgi:hypothetical protein